MDELCKNQHSENSTQWQIRKLGKIFVIYRERTTTINFSCEKRLLNTQYHVQQQQSYAFLRNDTKKKIGEHSPSLGLRAFSFSGRKVLHNGYTKKSKWSQQRFFFEKSNGLFILPEWRFDCSSFKKALQNATTATHGCLNYPLLSFLLP